MNPDNIIQIGPLALALDRLVAVGLMLAFLTALDWIVRRYRVAAWQPAGVALLAGLVAARAVGDRRGLWLLHWLTCRLPGRYGDKIGTRTGPADPDHIP